jgi:hypothetical protein
MTIQDQEITPVTSTIVADADRLDFFPTYFGKYFMAGENLLYVHADRFVAFLQRWTLTKSSMW